MKTLHILPAFAVLFSAALATAHTGAQGVVLERMQGMTALADTMKALAPMVRGQVAYDSEAVAAAGVMIQNHSGARAIALFERGTEAAPSEASPAIWEDPQEFEELFMTLSALGGQLSSGATSPERTSQTFGEIGRSCVACHESYRIKRE